MEQQETQKIAIIGAGRGGLSLLTVLRDNKNIDIVGICDVDPGASGMLEAKKHNINSYANHDAMLEAEKDIDLLIDVSGNEAVKRALDGLDTSAEVIHGKSAALLWELTSTQSKIMNETRLRMVELQDLYQLGLRLSSSTDLKEIYAYVIKYATRLTETPAGSIAIVDENSGDMVLAHSEGFSEDVNKLKRWKLRPGGLTSHILNQDQPVIIPDIGELEEGVNPVLARAGVKSIIATPLTARGKIIGILYVDDFVKRDFDENAASILGLLSGYAALSIEKMRLLEYTKKMAITDGLTGLQNQQEFFEQLDSEMARAHRYDRTLSVVELDIDFFKPFNDKFGHPAGNELLRLLARTLTDNSRQTDQVSRTGGEEFAILMPETGLREAAMLAERLRVVIEGLFDEHPDVVKVKTTVSIGVGTFPEHGSTATELFQAVDKALYQAKETGRNRVIVFPDQTVDELADESTIPS